MSLVITQKDKHGSVLFKGSYENLAKATRNFTLAAHWAKDVDVTKTTFIENGVLLNPRTYPKWFERIDILTGELKQFSKPKNNKEAAVREFKVMMGQFDKQTGEIVSNSPTNES